MARQNAAVSEAEVEADVSEVAAALDFDRLDIRKDSFIDPELQEHFSDILYRVGLAGGGESYVYVLFEHKSYPDPRIAWQLLRYMTRIWEQADKQKQPLLPIVPLVVYHGRPQWRISPYFSDLFDLPDVLRPYFPDFRYFLADLGQVSDEEIKHRVERAVILQIGLLSLKYIYAEDVAEQLKRTIRLALALLDQETGLEYIQTILRYHTAGTDKLSESDVKMIVQTLIDEGDNLMPTLAEQWVEQGKAIGLEKGREEGEAIGRQKGREEGREEGREAALNVLRRFLATRFGVALDHFDAALQSLDLAALTALSEAAFEAESLAAFETKLAELQLPAENDPPDDPVAER
jgi:predicted transposase/invertase (TIGR01784 family)